MALALTKDTTTPGFTSYKTDIDYNRPVAWALITSGYKRTITLVWYHSAQRQTKTEEGFKSVTAARVRLEAVEAEVTPAIVIRATPPV